MLNSDTTIKATLEECESRNVDYLFRLRQSANVKKLIARLFHKDGWRPADCGYEAYEATLNSLAGRASGAWWCCVGAFVFRRLRSDQTL